MKGRVGAGGLRYVAQRLLLFAVFACLLFASAGRVDWWPGWRYLLVTLVMELVTLSLLAWLAPQTLNQRGSIGAGVKPFERWFAALWFAMSLVTPVIVGLDAVRFRWSALPAWLFVPALWVMVAASLFGDWAMVENEHFEQFVRIQGERGHDVVTTGPYRFVQHPGYLGAILGALATPPMLGSAWAFVPAGFVALMFIVRTYLEDQALRRELSGYEQYAQRTRYRLLPLVW
jgi:protein-S-isoprenylcysteine O-methyltransferase Ste14